MRFLLKREVIIVLNRLLGFSTVLLWWKKVWCDCEFWGGDFKGNFMAEEDEWTGGEAVDLWVKDDFFWLIRKKSKEEK